MSDFGSRLKKLRAEKRLKQEDLAKIFRISKSSIGMYERGEREPSFDLVNAFADYFSVSTDFLLGRSSNKEGDLYSKPHKTVISLEDADEEKFVRDQIEQYRKIKRKLRAELNDKRER